MTSFTGIPLIPGEKSAMEWLEESCSDWFITGSRWICGFVKLFV
jgi:hypothetical protein